jgi:cell division protein FtsA
LLDIGGGTTDVAIFTTARSATPRWCRSPADQITNDIAMALRTPTGDAENIKTRHGVGLRQLADQNR